MTAKFAIMRFGTMAALALTMAACDRPTLPVAHARRNSDGWLTGAPDQASKDERLERYLRGFDQPMWEVGERYAHVEQALRDGNWALAA